MSTRTRAVCTAAATVFLCMTVGACDAVRTVAQPVDLHVLDRRTMEPVQGATVGPAGEPASRFTRPPGLVGKRDGRGAVRVNVNTTYLAGGVSGWLFDRLKRDRLTGTVREIAVVWNETRNEISALMEPGHVVEGEHFVVRIESIHRPFKWRPDDPESTTEEKR
jgi:hypothetical protein